MKNILIPVDGSVHSVKALMLGFDLGEKFGSKVTVMTVRNMVLPTEYRHFAQVEYNALDETRMHNVSMDLGKKLLLETISSAELKVQPDDDDLIVLFGDPAVVISEYVKDNDIDAVVMGSRGLSNLKGLFMGSISHKVNHLVGCTCINVK